MGECVFIGRLQIKDGKREEFGQVAERVMAVVGSNPGVTNYEWYVADDGAVTAVETYASGDAIMAHLGGPAGALLPEMFQFADIVDINVYGEPGEQAREAMASFPITFHGDPAFTPAG